MTDRERYECIDPDLGDQIWRLDDDATDPALRTRLREHVRYCASCRLERALGDVVVADATADAVRLAPVSWRRLPGAWLSGAGGALAAAGLALVLVLPPESTAPDGLRRGAGDAPAIVRPVEGEVVSAGRPSLRWNPVDDARAYRVSVRSVDGEIAWEAETEAPRIRIPADASLPPDRRFRVAVSPVPSYLGDAAGLRTTFRTGRWWDVLAHRVRAGAVPGRVIGAVGLVALLAGAAVAFWRRR